MKAWAMSVAAMAGVLLTATVWAQSPATAPAGSTGLCNDGSYWNGPTKKGACRGHHGVKDWYAAAAATGSTAAMPAAPATAATAPMTTPVTAAPAPAAMPSKSAGAVMKSAVAGGGPGMVWVNKSSKVYHCSGDKWYGKTKAGEYMSEQDAKTQGYHADHGKACGSN